MKHGKGINMDVNLLSKRFGVRRLDRNDVEIIYDMNCFSVTGISFFMISA